MLNDHQTMNTLINAFAGVALTLGLVALYLAAARAVFTPCPARRKR
jgi:hypothetical protein